jgi:hypothetical protein
MSALVAVSSTAHCHAAELASAASLVGRNRPAVWWELSGLLVRKASVLIGYVKVVRLALQPLAKPKDPTPRQCSGASRPCGVAVPR